MAANPQTAHVSLDDFMAAVEASEERLEYVDGEVVAMAGSSLEHGLIVQNLATLLGTGLRGRPCRVLSQGTLVGARPGDNTFLPDVIVYCGAPQRDRIRGVDVLLNPLVIVEVLSKSTADYDHGTKWESYRRIAGLTDYLLVSQDQPRVERYTRRGEHFWHYSETLGPDAVVRLEELDLTLRMADVYEGLPADADGARSPVRETDA